MALFYDVTKASRSRQLSGLIRVSEKMRHALEEKLKTEMIPVVWHSRKQKFFEDSSRVPLSFSATDHFITPEVFSSENRPGFYEFIEQSGVKCAAVFHDAIPLKFPEITWPQSVARYPLYLRDLARLTHVFSVSGASQRDLVDFWDQMKISKRPGLSTLTLGADFFDRSTTAWQHEPQAIPLLLNIGIIEPRKNQIELLEVAENLWDAGLKFEFHFIGRINPHFGKPIEKKIRQAKKAGYSVQLHSKQSDGLLLDLYSRAHFTVFNSITEGFGLPVIESLWMGLPCITKALPSLTRFIDGSTCRSVDSRDELQSAIENLLIHPLELARVTSAARERLLPTWEQTAQAIVDWKDNS